MKGELFYVRILHDIRTFGYLIPQQKGRQAVSISLLERRRMLGSDYGIAVWKMDPIIRSLPRHELYRIMEGKDKATADVLHIRDTR